MKEILIILIPCLAFTLGYWEAEKAGLIAASMPAEVESADPATEKKHLETLAEIDEQRKRNFRELSTFVKNSLFQSNGSIAWKPHE